MKTSTTLIAYMAFLALVKGASIDFDHDASGQPMGAPRFFMETTPLRDLYGPLGVHFDGPFCGPTVCGGAILNHSTFAPLMAHSGRNFLAFNRDSYAQDPETITFDTPMFSVSLFVSGAGDADTFVMQGYDANDNLLGTQTFRTEGYLPLHLASSAGIRRVVISVTDPGLETFVFDDLTFVPVPEPGVVALLALALVAFDIRFGLFQKRYPRRT